jgi:hypothetical protein
MRLPFDRRSTVDQNCAAEIIGLSDHVSNVFGSYGEQDEVCSSEHLSDVRGAGSSVALSKQRRNRSAVRITRAKKDIMAVV